MFYKTQNLEIYTRIVNVSSLAQRGLGIPADLPSGPLPPYLAVIIEFYRQEVLCSGVRFIVPLQAAGIIELICQVKSTCAHI